jgi:hypothetical protein
MTARRVFSRPCDTKLQAASCGGQFFNGRREMGKPIVCPYVFMLRRNRVARDSRKSGRWHSGGLLDNQSCNERLSVPLAPMSETIKRLCQKIRPTIP